MKKEIDLTDRLTFLAETFDVFENNAEGLEQKSSSLIADGFAPTYVTDGSVVKKSNTPNILAIVSTKAKMVKANEIEHFLTRVSVSSDVFSSMIEADPTENKMYLQWMLNLFTRLLKGTDEYSRETAIRFAKEDLPQANQYLILFEANKRKKLFKELCKGSYLKEIQDPTDINQFKSLSQLFDAVDPFIVKEPSAVERTLQRFVDAGQALIPAKDRKFTLYIPLTTEASVVFESYANWCTARKGNGMFDSYTTGHKKPNGKNSNIYIIINNKFFSGESDEVYQIHFETKQIKDKGNGQNVSIFEKVINESEALSTFFYDELMGMAKENKKGIENNQYLEYLIQFGFAESLFEFMDATSPSIKFMTKEIPRLPDLSKFKELASLIVTGAKLSEIHPSIGYLNTLQMVVLTNNNLKTLPKEIGMLKNLEFLNVTGNKISHFPDELAYLDKSRGGSLQRIGVKVEDIGEENYRRLKELLPTTEI